MQKHEWNSTLKYFVPETVVRPYNAYKGLGLFFLPVRLIERGGEGNKQSRPVITSS